MEKELDLLGMVCPLPILKTEKELESLKKGDRLRIKLDSNRSVVNILEFCEDHSLQFEVHELIHGIWEILIERGGDD